MKHFMLWENTNTDNKKSIVGIMNLISFFAFCLMIMDCAVSGGGHWLMIGPLSLRMILLFLAFFFAVPSIVNDMSKWVKNPMLIGLGLFVVYLVVSIFLGISNANRIDVLLSDIKGFAWLATIPVALVVLKSEERIKFLLRCLIFAAVLQALMIIALNIICALYDNWVNVFYEPLIMIQLGFADSISSTMTRIFFKSGPYLAVGVITMLYLHTQREKFVWVYPIGIGLCLTAILLSFTRSLYGASFLAVISFIVLSYFFAKRYWKKILLTMVLACLMAVILITVQQVAFSANYLRFAVIRTFSIEIASVDTNENLQQKEYMERTKRSDQVYRETTLNELKEMIGESPVFGNGLGASISYREDGLVEYFYHDILNKMGIVGLLLYYSPIGYMIYILSKVRKFTMAISLVLLGVAIFCGLSVFLLVTYFNPYMNASIGISCYSISVGYFEFFKKKVELFDNC